MDYSNVPYSRKILLAFLVVSVTFMELLDTTIINTAIPPISKALNVDVLSLKAAVTVYLISLAIFIPISGWIAETFGTKRTIISAVLLFTVSSFLCGNSKTIEELIIFRIIQGVGAALMTPVSRLILIHIFRRDELLKVSSIVGIPIIFGPIVGPLLGGFITTNFEWYWIFYINVPIGIIVVILMSVFLKTLKQHEKVKFDFPGFVLFGLGLASVSFVFENEGNPVFKKHTLIILLITGLLIL
ncbi:MAG: MFS transporter, partial [Ignavibacteriae bacterium]|nr:MFS transporter [Ignavibacteriota bacterium]